MSRGDKKKIDTSAPAAPLQVDAFDALNALDAASLKPDSAPPAASQPGPVAASAPKSRGRVVLRREKKDRGGKTVVIVSGFQQIPGFNSRVVAELARELRQKLGCGGSAEGWEIMLQGDRPAEVAACLTKLGFRVEGVTK
jgi:translation initiation factor 1